MPDDGLISPASTPVDDTRLREALRALPLQAPIRSVLPMLQERLAQRRRKRWRQAWLPLAAVATVGFVTIVSLLQPATRLPTQPAVTSDPELAALIQQNQVYESALRNAVFGSRAQSAQTVLVGTEIEDLIGMLDLELSAADRPAQQRDLWQQRLALMQELTAVRAGATPEFATSDPAAYQNAVWPLN